ncbi:MAG: DNA-formamidopyrimidine glycosylase, partial [Leptospiraceae bacterium]|nr:DNA-formamidopyrimidine glycosylase [Leptospiraceae bacterium]
MPELPEVETVVRTLAPLIEQRIIVGFDRKWKRVLGNVTLPALRSALQGRRIVRATRRAKFVILELDDASRLALHLRMTGKLYPAVPEVKTKPAHISAIFHFSEGPDLIFEDQRRFGRIYYLSGSAEQSRFFADYGPEPLDGQFNAHRFFDDLQKRKRQIKPLLLDQSFVAGLGNIYVDESLWLARIHPLQNAAGISRKSATALHGAIQKVLRNSIASNGTTFMNFRFLGG